MSALVLALLLAAAVKDGQTPLRADCSPDARVLASLAAGAPVTIKYSINGETGPCYKVSVEVDGKTLEGSLPASTVEQTDDFDQARRQAVWMDTPLIVSQLRASTALPSLRASPGVSPETAAIAQKASDMISSSRPQRALELLEPELKVRRDPGLLALAGVAAWRSDDPRLALEYLRASLDIAPTPEVDRIFRQVERESKNDQSNDRLYGLRVLLRYEN